MYEHIPTIDIDINIGDFVSSINMSSMDMLAGRVGKASLIVIDEGLLQGMEKNARYKSIARVDVIRELVGELVGDMAYIVIPGGEIAKSRFCFNLLLETLFSYRCLRSDSIAVIGGGAVCDMVAYVASTYMRGLSITLVPSSLLAMVDASIGGKTAINFASLKNMVGAFYPANEIIIVPALLQFLSPSLLKDGLAEIIKAGCLKDEKIIDILEKNKNIHTQDFEQYQEMWIALIRQAIAVKSYFVERDFKEQNIRAHLNLGHTFAHAHEASARKHGRVLSHGEAVGLGIKAALHLGILIQEGTHIVNESYAKRIWNILDAFDYPKNYEGYIADELVDYMYMDKKRTREYIRFVVQYDICNTDIIPVEKKHIMEVLKKLGAS